MKKQKFYCYVDESGQDTEGKLFIVSVVVVGVERDTLRQQLEDIEQASGKQARKWTHSKRNQRRAYIKRVLENPLLVGALYYSVHRETRSYVNLTILSVAKAIDAHASQHRHYTAVILVDGIDRTEQHRFSRDFRKLHINTREVRGMNDETDVFIRLADSLAGFVRDSLAGDPLLRPMYLKAIKKKLICEV